MKNVAFGLLTFLFVAASFTACKKEEQKLTLDEQVTGTWASQTVRVDDTNVSSVYTFSIAFRTDHSFTLKTTSTNPLTQQSATTTNTGNWSAGESAHGGGR